MIIAALGVFAFVFLGLSGTAHAWGTGAHVDFGLSILANAAMLTPALRTLLKRFSADFLYGNLAADTVIGKSLADEHEHVHNWEVAIRLFDLAPDDAGKAFVFGYLSHLAADTVAHNYMVPKKRVDGFRSVTAGHAYWELRYDSFLPGQVWDASRDLGKQHFEAHDELLGAGLKPTLLTMKANAKVYGGFLTLTRRVDRWRDLMRAHAERSATPFGATEREEFRGLAIQAIAAFLMEFRESKTYLADPTGNSNLEQCWRLGSLLRKGTSAGAMDVREADEIARQIGRALREGLHVEREIDFSAALRAAGA